MHRSKFSPEDEKVLQSERKSQPKHKFQRKKKQIFLIMVSKKLLPTEKNQLMAGILKNGLKNLRNLLGLQEEIVESVL